MMLLIFFKVFIIKLCFDVFFLKVFLLNVFLINVFLLDVLNFCFGIFRMQVHLLKMHFMIVLLVSLCRLMFGKSLYLMVIFFFTMNVKESFNTILSRLWVTAQMTTVSFLSGMGMEHIMGHRTHRHMLTHVVHTALALIWLHFYDKITVLSVDIRRMERT